MRNPMPFNPAYDAKTLAVGISTNGSVSINPNNTTVRITNTGAGACNVKVGLAGIVAVSGVDLYVPVSASVPIFIGKPVYGTSESVILSCVTGGTATTLIVETGIGGLK